MKNQKLSVLKMRKRKLKKNNLKIIIFSKWRNLNWLRHLLISTVKGYTISGLIDLYINKGGYSRVFDCRTRKPWKEVCRDPS